MDRLYFVFIYHRGPGWLADRPMAEQPFIEGHFNHMTQLEEQATLILGGPFKDDSGALGILQAPSLAEAQQAVAGDPVVRNGIVVVEVRPWHPAVRGTLELKPW